MASSRATGAGVGDRVQPRHRQRVEAGRRPDARRAARFVGPRRRQGSSARPGEDPLLAVAHETGLHQELHVAVRVGARDVEPCGPALGALAQELLDEPIADVAGIGHPDGVELHDRPLVADRLALDADEAGDPAVLLVDVHEVVRAERAQRQAEQAEDPDRRAGQRQAQRAGVGAVGLAQPRQLPEGREVREARGPDLAAAARGARAPSPWLPGPARRMRRRPEPSPGSSCSAAIVAMSRWKRVSPGELRMEGRGDDVALADGDDAAVVEAREDVDGGPAAR